MPDSVERPPSPQRRRTLVALVNGAVAIIGGALTSLLGVFALKPGATASTDRWIKAGTLDDLKADLPTAKVLVVPRVDGWYRERAPQTVFLVWDGDRQVRALSATCTHLGCQVHFDAAAKKFNCPCHGGVYDISGKVLDGPPPRPLDVIEARIDSADDSVLVRL